MTTPTPHAPKAWTLRRVGLGATHIIEHNGTQMFTVWFPPTDDGEKCPIRAGVAMILSGLNALAGVADPAAFVARAKDNELVIRDAANAIAFSDFAFAGKLLRAALAPEVPGE